MMNLQFRRLDGTFVAEVKGMPYHIIEGDEPMWSEALNLAAEMGDELQLEPSPPAEQPIAATVISDRQFAQKLAIDGVITEAEALAWAARGDLPAALEAVVSQLGQQEFAARMLLSAATTYERAHPLTATLGGLLGYEPADLDRLWQDAAAL